MARKSMDPRASLLARMKRRKLTQAELGKLLGYRQNTISLWLSGKRVPEGDARAVIQRELGIPASAWARERMSANVCTPATESILRECAGFDK